MRSIDDRELAELAREIPWNPPDAARREALREAIVLEARETTASPPAPRSRRGLWLGGAAVVAVAAAAVAIVALRGGGAPAPGSAELPAPAVVTATHRAKVQASSAADFVHSASIESGVNDEIVRLRGGRVSVAVERLEPDQRFRVVAGDGEVEVRGTAFDVVVVEDRLESVVVHHGLVVVRLRGEAPVEVAGGQHWSRVSVPVPVPVPDPVPVDPPADMRPRTPSDPLEDPLPPIAAVPTPAPGAVTGTGTGTGTEPEADSPIESDFRSGRLALRDGDFATAADLFLRAIASDPDAPLAEDARYWRAVALARAGKDTDAHDTLEAFLLRHPTSMHAGRASLMLGNLLVKAGNLDAARPRYQAALADSDPEVRAAARKALDALH
jgi:TolA-binding protein